MAKDIIHDAVKQALIKDGWVITHDQYNIRFGTDDMFADLAAEKEEKVIIVEVKSFRGPSSLQDFKEALGQYILYLTILAIIAPDYKLYLAVSEAVYRDAFQRPTIQKTIETQHIALIVVDIHHKEIVQWIN